MQKKISILGAGLVGSLLSIMLAKRKYAVDVFERRTDMRLEKNQAGRSINLALSDRGWKALESTGIAEDIRKISIPMYGRMIHDVSGKLNFLPYGKKDQAIYSVSRAILNCKLMDIAESFSNVKFHFNHRCSKIDFKNNHLRFEDHQGAETELPFEFIFGADGAFSAGRLQMQLQSDLFNYSQFYIQHGYKELNIPAVNNNWAMDINALHIWPRGQFMLIALPNTDKSFTCTLFFPFEGEVSFASLNTKEKVLAFFKNTFPDAIELMPELLHDFINNPVSSLVTVKCFPWTYQDKMCLIGDAAHAIVPFFGQGMNCGFEDCSVLESMLDKNTENWQLLLSKFEAERKPDTDAIAELALANFIEMRDQVTDEKFLLKKNIESWFSSLHPDKWQPLYTMVTFTHMKYSEALALGKKQERIMNEVLEIPGIFNDWKNENIERIILDKLKS
jgi:kynurenine 3-monooxygenase